MICLKLKEMIKSELEQNEYTKCIYASDKICYFVVNPCCGFYEDNLCKLEKVKE